MRRNEALQLRYGDYIACSVTPRILLREGKIYDDNQDDHVGEQSKSSKKSTKERELKTPNAKRNLFLADLMPEEEWSILNWWYAIRSVQLSKENRESKLASSLFYIENSAQSVMASNVMDFLMKLIRDVTQTANFKYHQLRHSFASWQMLAIFSSEYDIDVSSFFTRFPLTVAWLQQAKQRRGFHLPVAKESNSRKYAYWLQQTMGHANIEMTLAHYIHFMDIILLKMSDRQTKITQHLASQLSGLSVSSIKKADSPTTDFVIGKQRARVIKKGLLSFNSISQGGVWQPPDTTKQIIHHQKNNNLWQLPERVLRLMQQQKSVSEIQEVMPEFTAVQIDKLCSFFSSNHVFRLPPLNKSERKELERLIAALHQYNMNWIDELSYASETDLTSLVRVFSRYLKPVHHLTTDKDETLANVADFRLLIDDMPELDTMLRASNILLIPVECVLWHDSRLNQVDLEKQKSYWSQFVTLPITTRKIGPRSIGERGYLEVRFKYSDARLNKNRAAYWLLVQLAAIRWKPS